MVSSILCRRTQIYKHPREKVIKIKHYPNLMYMVLNLIKIFYPVTQCIIILFNI